MDSDRARRRQELQREIQSLDGRDYQLWSITALLFLVLAGGFIALVWPNLMWELGTLEAKGRYLPQLFFGFAALVVLFNVYILEQRRSLRRTRGELLRQLIHTETLEELAMVDPLTETYNRRSMDDFISKEVSRADRLGTELALLMIDLDQLRHVNARFGHLIGDHLLTETAAALRATFRKSDTLIRYGGDEFLVVMPEASQQQAQLAVGRLLERVDIWNHAHPDIGYQMALSCGLAAYRKGMDMKDVLAAADKSMYEDKARRANQS